jgi:hypothetical protein
MEVAGLGKLLWITVAGAAGAENGNWLGIDILVETRQYIADLGRWNLLVLKKVQV